MNNTKPITEMTAEELKEAKAQIKIAEQKLKVAKKSNKQLRKAKQYFVKVSKAFLKISKEMDDLVSIKEKLAKVAYKYYSEFDTSQFAEANINSGINQAEQALDQIYEDLEIEIKDKVTEFFNIGFFNEQDLGDDVLEMLYRINRPVFDKLYNNEYFQDLFRIIDSHLWQEHNKGEISGSSCK